MRIEQIRESLNTAETAKSTEEQIQALERLIALIRWDLANLYHERVNEYIKEIRKYPEAASELAQTIFSVGQIYERNCK